MEKQDMKLPKLELKRGAYQGTNGYGHEVYAAPYYVVKEVDEFVKAAETMRKELVELRAKLSALESQKPVAWGAFYFGGKYRGQLHSFHSSEDQVDQYIAIFNGSKATTTLRKGRLYAEPVPAEQVPDAIQLLQRVAEKTTERGPF